MYRKMYVRIFNAATDALEMMEQQNFGKARDILIAAQQACEEIYLEEVDVDEA